MSDLEETRRKQTEEEGGLIPLPPGYRVKYNSSIGFEYYNDQDVLIMQNPYDYNSSRRIVWGHYNEANDE